MATRPGIGACTLFAATMIIVSGNVSAERVLTVRDEGSGQTFTLTGADASFVMSEFGETLNISVDAQPQGLSASSIVAGTNWLMKFEAPPGEQLLPGRYEGAGCPGQFRTGRAPSLEVTEDNPLCQPFTDSIWGSFVIRQIGRDDAGNINAIELTFKQRTGSPTGPALTGLLRIDTAPLSFTVRSDPGFAWGHISQKHYGDSSLFSLTGTTAGVDYTASVIKDYWSIAIVPPIGRSLQAGARYSTRNFADGPHAGLSILRGLELQGCVDATGWLRVNKLEAAPDGKVLGLHADLEYHCGGTLPALRGTIRYRM